MSTWQRQSGFQTEKSFLVKKKIIKKYKTYVLCFRVGLI